MWPIKRVLLATCFALGITTLAFAEGVLTSAATEGVVDAQVPDTLTLTNITGPTTLAAGAMTTAVAPLAITETRNASGTTFPGLIYTITDTASAAGSAYMRLYGGVAGTTSQFGILKNGTNSTLQFGGAQPHYLAVNANILSFGTSDGGSDAYVALGRVLLSGGSGGRFEPSLLQYGSGGILGWASSNPSANAAIDTSLSLVSAGVVAVGTGAAGSTAGSMSLATLTHNKAEVDTSFSYNTPTTGATLTAAAGEQRTIVNPAGTLATLTLTAPPSPVNGQIWGAATTQVITALTVVGAGGATVVAPPSTLAVSEHFNLIYRATGTSWYPAP